PPCPPDRPPPVRQTPPPAPPARGGVALPGGFVDDREDWRQAVTRELKEETGIDAAGRDVRLADAMSSSDGHLLIFGLLPERPAPGLPPSA
ncbi:NUDIX domain-containing protein, partial [Streptomyces olivaceus]|uniref:NUDIX domain-containing protein n=1 Tax=Streptomyces olivaceus TaxID=47716 RepID=UPI00366A044F